MRYNPRPNIVLMDYRMPGVNGIQVTKRILEMDPEVKVIFISADDRVQEEAIRAGAVRFIQKPASVSGISGAVEGVGVCR